MFFVLFDQFNALSIQNDVGFVFSESWLSIKVSDCSDRLVLFLVLDVDSRYDIMTI